MSRSIHIVLAMVLGATLVSAQVPYGLGTPGTGGVTPQLSCPQAFIGNGAFQVQITNGAAGALAFVALSSAQDMGTFQGSTVLINQALILFISPVVLDANGEGAVPLPIPSLPPGVAGLKTFAQAMVLDYATGGPATSNGLEITLTLAPQVFVGTSVGGSTDNHYFVNPATLSLEYPATGNTFTDNVTDAVYHDNGRGLFVSCSITSQVNQADLTAVTPSWSTLTSFGSTGCYGLGLDESLGLLWTKSLNEFQGIDVSSTASPSYGTVIHATTGLSTFGPVERWAYDPENRRAAALQVFGAGLYVWDLDPSSPSFLTQTHTLSVPSSGASGFALNSKVTFSPDGDRLFVLTQHAGTVPAEIAQYSFGLGAWIDHDLTTTPVDNIGQFSNPPVTFGSAPHGFDMHGSGTFLCVSGFGANGWAGRLDVDPNNPFFFQWLPATGTTFPNAWGCAVNADGDTMAVTSWSPPSLKFVDLTTMAFTGQVALPNGSNIYTVVWR